MPAVGGCAHTSIPRAVGSTMMRVDWRIHSKPNHITPCGRILAQHVVDLVPGKIPVASSYISHPIRIDQGEQGGVRRVTQRAPLVQPSQPARGVGNPRTVLSHGPIVEPFFCSGFVDGFASQLGQQHRRAVALVIPVMGPLEWQPSNVLAIDRLRFRQVSRFPCGSIHPSRCPSQLIVIPRPRVVIYRGIGNRIGIFSAILIGKVEQGPRVSQALVRVDRIRASEQDRGGSHGRCCLSGQIRSGLRRRDSIGRPSHGHGFGRTPVTVIQRTIANLAIENIIRRMSLHQPIRAPTNHIKKGSLLTRLIVGRSIFDSTPGQEGHGAGHR